MNIYCQMQELTISEGLPPPPPLPLRSRQLLIEQIISDDIISPLTLKCPKVYPFKLFSHRNFEHTKTRQHSRLSLIIQHIFYSSSQRLMILRKPIIILRG